MKQIIRALALAATMAFVVSSCWFPQQVNRSTSGQSWADPFLLKAGSTWYTYSTNVGFISVPVRSTTQTNNTKPTGWGPIGEAFPGNNHPTWVRSCNGSRHVWGPTVVQRGSYYYLYYSAAIACDGSAFGEHAIGVARSTSPAGPFVSLSNTPLLRDPYGRGVIDPEIYDHTNGQTYLIFSTDWGPTGPGGATRTIASWKMASTTSLTSINGAGNFGVLLTAAGGPGWEAGVVEAPSMVRTGSGLTLFYSGGIFDQHYRMHFASCPGPVSACTRNTDDPNGLPMSDRWLSSYQNPGGAHVMDAVINGSRLMAFHELEQGRREMMLAKMFET